MLVNPMSIAYDFLFAGKFFLFGEIDTVESGAKNHHLAIRCFEGPTRFLPPRICPFVIEGPGKNIVVVCESVDLTGCDRWIFANSGARPGRLTNLVFLPRNRRMLGQPIRRHAKFHRT